MSLNKDRQTRLNATQHFTLPKHFWFNIWFKHCHWRKNVCEPLRQRPPEKRVIRGNNADVGLTCPDYLIFTREFCNKFWSKEISEKQFKLIKLVFWYVECSHLCCVLARPDGAPPLTIIRCTCAVFMHGRTVAATHYSWLSAINMLASSARSIEAVTRQITGVSEDP